MANRGRERYAPRAVSLLLDSLPANGEDCFTGIGCPDHMYSCAELLASKEEVLERQLWTAFSSLEELAILLGDFRRHGLEPTDPENQHRRGAIAREQAAQLWTIIEADRPLLPRVAEAFGDLP